jgi:hypothetical protein
VSHTYEICHQKQVAIEGALKVAKDTHRNHEMGLTGVLHVVARLLDHVGDVNPGEGEVLESPDQATVSSRVTDGGLMLEKTLA